MADSLPKYMLLDQNSQQIRDRRIMPETIYTQEGDRAIVTKKKKITNTIIMPRKVNKSSSIFNLQYSSKYGLLFLATDNEVIIKTTQQMEQDLIAEQHHNNFNLTIKFSGELFLSPDEEILAVCSQSLIQFVKVSSLAKPKNIEVPPVSNINDANHFLWIDNNNFLGWKFQGTAMLYTIDNATLTLRLQQRQLPMEEVTGASAINSRLFLVSKMLIKIFEPFTIDQPVVKAEVDMTDPGHESPYFQYSYIVDIFKININEKQFTPNDIYGMVVVYYDEQEEAVDERYITFAKGDIFNRQSLELRGYENLYSSKNSRELFYNSLDQKMSFGVKRVISSGFICLAIQRSEKIYVIDPLEDFQRINIYDIKSKHELKNEQGKFLQGVALMKNMLESQKSIPDKAEQLLVQIINKYNGQFMSLYFKDKQTSLTISFPSSILAIGGERFYRRYAISSIDGIEDENSEEILKKISLIKQSPHILPAALCKKVGQKAQQEIKKKEEKKEQQKVQIKQVKEEKKEGQGEKKESVGKEQAKVQLKKEEVAKQNSNKKQQVKIEEKKQEKPIQKKEQKPIQKKEQKVSPYAITEKDRSKPPMTTAELFATSNSLFSAPKPPPIIQKQKKAEEPKNAIQPQNKDQSKNPFAGMTKQNTANSFFKGNQSGNLFSNVPNLFEKKPASQPQPSFNPPTNIFSQVPTTNLFSPAQPKPSSVKSQEGVFAVSESKEVKAAEAFKLGPSSSSSVNSLFNKPVGSVIMSNVPINNEQVLPKQENKPLINLFKPSSFNDDLKPPSKSSFFPQEIRIQKQPLRQGSKSAKIPNQVKPAKPQPQQNKQSQVQQILNQSLLQSISQKVSVFRTWQKDTFSQKSKDAEPTSLPNIKQLYNRQLKILSNLRGDFFKETQQPMSEYYTKSIKKSPTFEKIQTDPSFQQNEQKLKQNLTYYEQVSDKMLYYINQLGKKNQNMRASNLAKNSYEKAANFLARITQDNQQKIIVLEKESQMKMEQLRTISNQRIKEKRKRKEKNKGKRYNFQDQTQEQYQEHPSLIFNADTTSSQTNIKPIKAVIINLDTIKEAPKIKLPEFENKSNFASQVPKKVDSQSSSKNVSKVPQPSSFAEKIPPKKQKVLVPVIENPQPKKQEQKQAISQVYSEQDVDQLEIPTAKRQISSIQTAQVKGLKLSTQFKPKQQTEVKPAQPKKNIFGGGQKKEGEDPMLFSQTTSVFNSSKNNTSMFNTTANVKPKEEEKKEGQAKMFGFNPPKKQQKTTVIQAQTNIFGPKPSASQTNPLLSIFSKGNQKKTQQKKAEEPQSNQQQKSLGEPNTNKTSVSKTNGLQSAFNNLGFGQQNKIQQKGQNIQKQQNNSKPNLKPSPSRTEPATQNTAAQQNKPTATSQQQNNASNPLPTSDPKPNPNLNPNNKPAPNFQNMGNAFMGGSFGSQPAPQFGGGNKFLNNNMQTGNNSSGFNPNTAKFAGLSNNNAPKTFTSFGGDNKIFQQQPSSNNIPFANETNIFNQSNTNSTDPQSNTSNFNNNQAFNQNQTNNSSFPNANSTNVTTNNAFNPSNNPFNKPSNNVFANSNAFANNNSFNNTTNNAFGSSNNNNNTFGNNNNAFSGFNNNNNNVFANNSNNSFNNNQGNTNMFNQNSNINAFGNNNSANTNFLANLKPPNVIPPPSSVNPALLQPRK